jgi:phospho-N-acetylmuramoyl-pentapeptide-transferase
MNRYLIYGIFSFFIAFFLFLLLIPLLKKVKITQYIRTEGPKSHFKKMGTPTGGGIIFLIIPILFMPFLHDRKFFFLYLALLLNGMIGFIDDFVSIKKKESLGLTARGKIILQILVAILLYFVGKPFITYNIMVNNLTLNIGATAYFLLYLFIMVGSPNAFNLTDGIDGLSTIVSLPIFFSFALVGGIAIKSFSLIVIGMLLAYLWFNSPKASIFMGDTGSLAIGGLVAAISVLGKFEILLAFLAIIPIIETVSVILQVSYFKITRGKRIFKMAPVHHHFELSGWSEATIDFRFFIITVLFCITGLVVVGGI